MLLRVVTSFLLVSSIVQAYVVNYYFHEDNDEEVNDCITTAIAQVMQDTCLEFKQDPQAHNAILFLESSRCGWQGENSTVHLNSDCLNHENCTQFVHNALSSPQQQHPSTVVRHLNMKFNCSDKCTIFCDNGGSVDQKTCSCKCSYGFSGANCEQLKQAKMYTDPSCGLIQAGNSGVISLKNEAESTTFCQWVLKADDPWKTFLLEFEDLDLDDGNTLPGQKCGDQLYIYGVKGVETPIPCGPNDQSLIGESVHSNSNVLFIEYRGNRLPSRTHKGPTLKYRTIGSSVSNEIRTFSSQQVSAGITHPSSSWCAMLALLPALLL